MPCPLCNIRKPRRACPALGRQICPVCCGSKRLVEISCPNDCPYLATAREHPPSVVMRQQEQDLVWLGPVVRDLSQLQAELFLVLGAAIKRYEPVDLQPLMDEDVAAAAGALASTLETSAKGVIYEHRPATRPAERLMGVFKAILEEAGKAGTPAKVEREAVGVLRRLEQSAAAKTPGVPSGSRAFIERLDRVLRVPAEPRDPQKPVPPERSRLIVP